MKRTYMSLYENEVRAAEIIIRDQDDKPYYPDNAFAQVLDSNDIVVVEEQECMIIENKAYTLINEAVTSIHGRYTILWRIVKNVGDYEYKYYHKTELFVEEL